MISPDTANPKDAVGRAKIPLHLWPASASAAGAVGILEGELKYGRNNFRATNVDASVYVAAAKRHIDAWFEGENNSDVGVPHLGNALACLAILVDAQANGTLVDDRNFTRERDGYAALVKSLTEASAGLKVRFGHVQPKHWDRRDAMGHEQALGKEPNATTVAAMMEARGAQQGWPLPEPASPPPSPIDEFLAHLTAAGFDIKVIG
jgi:hypothetical protein